MARDMLVQQTEKYRSIGHTEYPKFQTGIFGRMESAPWVFIPFGDSVLSLSHARVKLISSRFTKITSGYLLSTG